MKIRSPQRGRVPASTHAIGTGGTVTRSVEDLVSRMTLEEKIGQMTQIDRSHLKAEGDIAEFFLGSILSGGGSAPEPNTPKAWADMVDRYQSIARKTRLGIPLIYGIDAVHGHNNVQGATIFPHNIGLGATRNPQLVRSVGRVTASEVVGTGIHWTFAPCLAVARDERWGRTYESFGEDPDLVREMTRMIDGIQGQSLDAAETVLATAKHWVGDGGTEGGKDAGKTHVTEQELRDVHMAPYVDAIRRGVGAVMVSFSSVNGQPMHGNKKLITDVLKGDLGFSGIVVSDWGGVARLAKNYSKAVKTAINAGIDLVMVPDDYERFIETLTAEVENGTIPMSRIDDAVRRVLAKKFELGLFDDPLTDGRLTGEIGSDSHRAVARDAVRQSLVLLKNDDGLLPLGNELKRLFVAGQNADDIGGQCGGWTISWQGGRGKTTPGTTILEGIQAAVSPKANVKYDERGSGLDSSYDVVIAVIGEDPYAEGEGDRPDGLRLDEQDRALLRKARESGVLTVVVLVSGRPLIITDELPMMNAFVAAWLPGTEGGGVADVLFGDYDFTGKLPHSWPRDDGQIPINKGDRDYNPLWPFGYGMTYSDTTQ